MRRLVLVVLVALSLGQGYTAVQWSRYALSFTSARRLRQDKDYAAALDLFERAVRVRPSARRARADVGDTAERLYARPGTRRAPEEERAILARAWAGYAGAVAIAPLDSWSWSGLAEVAIREAQLKDRVDGVSLDVLAARSRGVLDPWRAVALGAAQLAVAISPSGYEELDVLAAVYESSGEVDRAADTYVRSAQLMSAPSFHDWGLGRTFAGPIYARLVAGLVSGITAAPAYDRSLLHLEVARFARAQGDFQTAAAQGRLSEQTASNSYERYRSASVVADALERADPEAALQAWRRAEQTGFDPGPVALRLAVLEIRLGDSREACGHFRVALREAPLVASLRIQAAGACEQAGENDTAEHLLIDGLDPIDAMPVAEALVAFLGRRGRLLTARSLVNGWLRDHPDRAEFKEWLERITAAQGTPAVALPRAIPAP